MNSRAGSVTQRVCWGLVIAVAETDLAVVDGFYPAVCDSDSEYVAAQMVEDLFTTARVLSVNDPFFLPD